MKRLRVGWITLLVAALLLAGCSQAGDGEPQELPVTAPPLRVLYATVEAGSEAVLAATERYRDMTGQPVEVDTFPYNSLQEKVFSELARKSDHYDLLAVDTPWMPRILPHLEPLSAYIQSADSPMRMDDFIAKVFLDTSVFDSIQSRQQPPAMDVIDVDRIQNAGFDIWSLPIQSNVLTVSYRKDLFLAPASRTAFRQRYGRELEVPRTLDEYLDIARFFTRDTDGDGLVDLYGTTLMAGMSEANFVDFKSFLNVYGGELFDRNLRPVFNSPAGVRALETYGDWILKDKVTPPGVTGYTWDEVEIAFGYGQTAMGMNYHDMLLNPKVKGQVGSFMFPGVEQKGTIVRGPHFGSWGLAVNKYSRQRQAAFNLAAFLTGAEAQQGYLKYRHHVTRISAYEAARHLPDAAQREYYDVLGASLKVGVGRPRIKNYNQLSEAVQTAVQSYLSGRQTAKAALDQAVDTVSQFMIMEGY
ncbi:extracellular solute-binding protein [Paenibacillus aurantiacus]|uniref:Extracellular solute-binding protein n=1 Tax=Paenibacillus aurantiacus TaxID=1936118 RepID=A0ABV5KVN9_9BACL